MVPWEELFKKVGKLEEQPMFEKLYHLSLLGMNIGGTENPEESGEMRVLEYVQEKYQGQGNLVIFDVGANVGEYTRLVLKLFMDKAAIYAFEPSTEAYFDLVLNLGENENISLYNLGFSNQCGRQTLYSDVAGSGLSSLYQRRLNHLRVNMEPQEEIELSTIDAFCSEHHIERIHFLKLDVEGHELMVLQGAANMLSRRAIDCIQFEFGGCNIDSRTFFQDFYYLLKDDYHIFRVLKDGLVLLSDYKEHDERFLMTNFLAERKE